MQYTRATRRWLTLATFAFVFLVLCVGIVGYLRWPYGEKMVVQALETKFSSRVHVKSFRNTYFPRPGYIAEGIVFDRKGDRPYRPFVTAQRISSNGSYFGLFRFPEVIQTLRIDGLILRVPQNIKSESTPAHKAAWWKAYRIDEAVADNALVEILRTTPGKPPLRFLIHHVRIAPITTRQPFEFQASLRIPRPLGEVETQGQFGPSMTEDLSQTPVSGTYTLRNAKLSTFSNISGILQSQAKFHGTLGDIRVAGTADTPDFELLSVHHPVPLQARYLVDVDGMDGDVRIDSFHAHFNRTELWATGYVKKTDGQKGKVTTVEMTVQEGHIQDLLYPLVATTPPAMKGTIHFQAKGVFPYNGGPFIQRMSIAGNFDVEQINFNHPATQEEVDKMSERAKGKKNSDLKQVNASLFGHVDLQKGVGTFSTLAFRVPGADAQVHGQYSLLNSKVDFQGHLKTRGTLSQDTTGIKSILLWPLNPFFQHHDKGADIPVKITGTYNHPHFGLALGHK